MNIPKTEQIRLRDSQSIFTVGLKCDDYTDLKARDVFKLETRYIVYLKNKERTYDKKKPLSSIIVYIMIFTINTMIHLILQT